MELDTTKYTELTGIVIPSEKAAQFKRAVRSAVRVLETYLGWRFNYSTLYTELGKVKSESALTNLDLTKLNRSDILPILEQTRISKQSVKFFNFDQNLSMLRIDPAENVLSVQLVVFLNNDQENYIVIKDLTDVMSRVKSSNTDLIHYLERRNDLTFCHGQTTAMLAVDANWLNVAPDELLDVLCELIDFFMAKSARSSIAPIKSESVDGHSVSYGESETPESILNQTHLKQIIQKYAGPDSPFVSRVRIR